MKIKLSVVFLLCFFSFTSYPQNEICTHIKILASDSLEGRKPGTTGIEKASSYIQKKFTEYRLQLLYDNGYQNFDVFTGYDLGSNNNFIFKNKKYTLEKDFIPLTYCNDTSIKTNIVFAGYGLSINTDSLKWDDYKNTNVQGKWVLVLRGSPDNRVRKNRFENYSSDRQKMLVAKDKGAAGILLVNGVNMRKDDKLEKINNNDKTKNRSSIAGFYITRKTANELLFSTGKSIESLEQQIILNQTFEPFEIKDTLETSQNFVENNIKTSNVVALLKSRKKSDEYIVIGAHYDHLGYGGPGSNSRKPDTVAVHNGADDNASGVACVLELAKRFSSEKYSGRFNLIFVAFSAEEMGLLGSAWFVKNPPVAKNKIKLMLNFDMVGRLNNNKVLFAGGTGTFPNAEQILSSVADTNTIKLVFSKEGYGPSDHASFYADSIPVLYFNTGVHSDYHRPSDDFEYINCEGLRTITDFTERLIRHFNKSSYKFTYLEAGPKTKSNERAGMKVTLGIMPDFSNPNVHGVQVAAVNQDGPAARCGMLKGDIITAIDGKAISNIYDYMERLKTLSPGQTINVDVLRNNEKIVLLIQL